MAPPRFWRPLIRLRHVIRGSLTLGSLNLACRDHVPPFPQRSPPSLLTTAACGGLRSTPDCRPRRTYLHLSYSYAAPCGPALLVTQGHNRTFSASERAGSGVYQSTSCQRGVPKPPGRNGSKGAVGGHSLTYFRFHHHATFTGRRAAPSQPPSQPSLHQLRMS